MAKTRRRRIFHKVCVVSTAEARLLGGIKNFQKPKYKKII